MAACYIRTIFLHVLWPEQKGLSPNTKCLSSSQMRRRARWATSPPPTAWTGGAPAATRAKIQRGWAFPPTRRVQRSVRRDGGQGRDPSWPGGRAPTRAKSLEWAPGRRGGPAALCLRKKQQSLRSATAASTGGESLKPGAQLMITLLLFSSRINYFLLLLLYIILLFFFFFKWFFNLFLLHKLTENSGNQSLKWCFQIACLVRPTQIQFTIIYNSEQQILTCEKLKAENIWCVCFNHFNQIKGYCRCFKADSRSHNAAA